MLINGLNILKDNILLSLQSNTLFRAFVQSMRYTVHIVSFNIPYPPDYGGVIDVFYKITALKKLGVDVILHCFSYGRPHSRTLEDLCQKVYYYHRDLNFFLLFDKDPFIVVSRRDPALLKNLCNDNYPIILEGIHCTAFLEDKALAGRFIMVRTHNIEHLYYKQLASVEGNVFRRLFFLREAKKLRIYEPVLKKASLLLSISPGDTRYFKSNFGNSIFVGPFHPSDECHSHPGKGNYILMHGDFSTPENNASGLFLLQSVISKWDHQTIIAGKRPSKEVVKAASRLGNVTVINNPSDDEMSDLIINAQICLLHSFQPTGMKLKLITSLCKGRHVISSSAVTSDTGLALLCHTANTPDEWLSLAEDLMKKPFTSEDIDLRNPVLKGLVDNSLNAKKIIDELEKNGRQELSA